MVNNEDGTQSGPAAELGGQLMYGFNKGYLYLTRYLFKTFLVNVSNMFMGKEGNRISNSLYSIYLPYPTLQFSRGVGKREKANGLCNPLMILFRWIFS